ALGQGWLQSAPALVAIVVDPARTALRYGAVADRFVAMEAGAAAQNLLLQALALGLGATLVGAFDAAAAARELALRAGEQLLALIAVGQAA
ncbi:MAG: nitroreductase family protein, partial [Rubrivivax sp.]|nr:nitroreductase family protein [Rubrivivax sp.]